MGLELDDIAFLGSARGAEVLAAYADADLSDANVLPLLMRLRQSLTLEQASAVLSTLRLRRRAAEKFPQFAAQMLFTAAGLEQASHPQVRQYRAGLMGSARVLDLCCGIGSDGLALAAAGREVLGLDMDRRRVAIARHNAAVMGSAARFDAADVREPLPAGYDGIFYDPARRDADGRRIRDVERTIPPLGLVRGWSAAELAVKLSPAVDLRQLAGYGGQVEFISLAGRLKEALLWLHRPCAAPLATVLRADGAHHLAGGDLDGGARISPPLAWLFEPDAAVIRAGALRRLAAELDAGLLHPAIAYLTMERRTATPWGRYWRVLDWMPFQLKRLRRYLVERGVRHLTVKKRGFALSPAELTARLRLKAGDGSRVLVLTRRLQGPIVLVCAPP